MSTTASGRQQSKRKDFVYTTSSSPNRTADTPRCERSPSIHHETPKSTQDSAHGLELDARDTRTTSPLADPVTNDSTLPHEASFVTQSLGVLPAIPDKFQSLFNYFVHGLTISISCHKGIQNEICSTIVPLSIQVPHLLSAVLALAAAHRQSSGFSERDCQFELMKGRSLTQLRSALDRFNPRENDQVLATTLILCMAEIISPTSNVSSWRSHLYGAATLSAHHKASSGASMSSTSTFLRRKYQALQAVALACGSKSYEGPIVPTPSDSGDAHIDDFAGYSTNLLPIFEEINNLGRIQEDAESAFACDSPPGPPHFDCSSLLEHKSHLLFDRIRTLMAQRKITWTQSSGDLPWAVYHDLYLLDEAYHHMALLQVFRRGSLSVPLRVVEDSRQSILDCLTALTYEASPCPGVAALSPLFIAGIFCTTEPDRQKVRSLLRTMWMNYGMGNVRSCQTVLQRWWKQQDERPLTPIFVDDDVLPY